MNDFISENSAEVVDKLKVEEIFESETEENFVAAVGAWCVCTVQEDFFAKSTP